MLKVCDRTFRVSDFDFTTVHLLRPECSSFITQGLEAEASCASLILLGLRKYRLQ